MNIKSLLLGSAAALVAVSGARAADAVVIAEPEPLEYVRICDVYGTGFYYIPGTETCLKVSGYLRYDIGVGTFGNQDVLDKRDLEYDGVVNRNDTYDKRARFALRVDARSETELGTLRGYAQINFDYDNTTAGIIVDGNAERYTVITSAAKINHAYIELGGFRIGKTDSLFSTMTGYAGGVIQDDIVSYGPFDTHQIAYTFTGANGFSAAVALEEGGGGESDIFDDVYKLDDYIPHVVAGAAWTQAWGGISGVVGYDAVWEEFAGKLRVDVNATEQLSLFLMAGYSSTDDVTADELFNFYGSWGGNWAVWGGGSFKATEQATINVQASYDELENIAVVANVAYELVPNFTITPEIIYADNLDVDDGGDTVGGFLRFQRNF